VTQDELRALLANGNGPQLDLQPESAPAKQLAASLVALANADGGTLILGADGRPGKSPGLANPDTARDKVMAAMLLSTPPLILPLPEIARLDDKPVILVQVPKGLPHVYSLKGKYLIRDGAHNRPMPTRQLRQLLLERGEVGYESLPTAGATLDDIDLDKVARYASALEGWSNLKPQEVLFKRGCLVKDKGEYRPTHAGILLFGREPARFLKSAEIIAVRYAGQTMGDAFVREDIRGTLPEQIRQAEAFVVGNMRKGARLVGWQRDEVAEYPVEVVREAIVNAVAHRDYSIRGDETRVSMFADRIEVYSPGRLPGHVTLKNIVDERFSRNEVIVQVLADLGFIEKLGYGIDRMIRRMQEDGLPRPRFAETANGFRVTLHGHGPRLAAGVGAGDGWSWTHLGLNERQQRALEYLEGHKRITNREYRELAPEVSEETIRRDLAELVEKNILLKVGDKKATYYILK